MYSVSAEYKSQINNLTRRPSHVKVSLGVVEPDAKPSSTLSASGESPFSNLADTINNVEMGRVYESLEHNRLILDGSGLLPPEIGEVAVEYQGWQSSTISGVDGVFTTAPILRIDFSQAFAFAGLTFIFDTKRGCYPSSFQLIGYLSGTEVYNTTKHPTSTTYTWEEAIPATGFIDRIDLVFLSTLPRRRRAIISYIYFGLLKTFVDSDLVSVNWIRDIDLLTSRLPRETLDFTIIDPERAYDPEDAEGIWQYMESRQPATFEYGFELEDGTIEWIPGGSLYTSDGIQVNSEGAIPKVTFHLAPYTNHLTSVYYKGVYSPTGTTLYDLAVAVFTEASLPAIESGADTYYVDPAISDVSTVLPLPELPLREVLQVIANAARCVIWTDRNGTIRMERVDAPLKDFTLGLGSTLSTPTVDKLPLVKTVDTSYGSVTVSATEEELREFTVSYTTATSVRLTYVAATDLSIETTGVTVTGTPELYASSCILVVNGSGTITIKGKELVPSTTGYSLEVNPTGYACPVVNPLISNSDSAAAYAQWIADILSRRNSYEVTDRGYPELDVLDTITVDTLLNTGLSAIVTLMELKYDGAIRGRTKYITEEVV